MKSPSLIHTSWLKPFAEFFAARGVDLSPYCGKAKIGFEQVTGGDSWITKQQLYHFLNALAAGEKMPELGFLVGETMTPDSLGGISAAMADARTLGDAIRVFCKVVNRSTEENRVWIEEGGDGELWLLNQTTNPFPADRRISDHAGLMSMVNLVRLAGGGDWYPREASLQTGSTSAYQEIQGLRDCVFSFQQKATGFPFPAAWLFSAVNLQVTKKPEPPISELLEEGEPPAEKLRRLVKAMLGVGGISPTAELMAELCGTSTRTLHRRLNECGSTYREILDEVRVEKAKELLGGGEVAVKELSYDLGYSGPNNFVRAFKRITGLTPLQFRDRHGGAR